jgi:hypothetical protein
LPLQKAGSTVLTRLSRAPFAAPQGFEVLLVAKRVHRLPEAAMLEGHQLAVAGEVAQRLLLPDRHVVLDAVQNFRREHEEAGVDRAAVAFRLFEETGDPVPLHVERAEPARRHRRGQRRLAAMGAVESDQSRDVDIADAVAIGHAEGVLVAQVIGDAQQAPAGHRSIAGVDQRHLPGFGAPLVHLHPVLAHMEGDVGHVQEVIVEILLDHIALIAKADHEFLDAVSRVDLHDVPQDRPAADLDHRLGADGGLLAEAGAEASGENNGFHRSSSLTWRGGHAAAGAAPVRD